MRLSQLITIVLSAVALTRAAPPTRKEFEQGVAKGLRLLRLGPDEDPVWKTEDEKLELIRSDVGFFDVTDVYDHANSYSQYNLLGRDVEPIAYPKPSMQDKVNQVIDTLVTANMQTNLDNLTSFHNRYYLTMTGAQASEWIRDTIAGLIESAPQDSGATVSLFSHSFVQSSVIARFKGINPSGSLTIIGAHIDSLNHSDPVNGRAPGADDDGSGIVNLIEAFRALISAGFKPQDPVEFHWYAGEEAGLLGSQDVAFSYGDARRFVKGMMQLDMTAYVKPGSQEVVGLVPDYTDSSLNSFVGSLVTTYCSIPSVVGPPCGYACSDHHSWNWVGAPAAFPFETPWGDENPVMHTSNDTTSATGFSWSHSLEYAKLVVAFAYELGNADVQGTMAKTNTTATGEPGPEPTGNEGEQTKVVRGWGWAMVLYFIAAIL